MVRRETVLASCFRFLISFLKKVTKPLGIELGDERDYGVGMFFFPE